MQLLALVLYNADGRTRRLNFRPGALNIVTGESETGKSALLTIVEYCLGRDTNLVPVGPISDTVAWYAALWELDSSGGRAFVARPKPAKGKASTSVAMLEFGTNLEPPPLESLHANIDSRQLRQQLGRRIGIEENLAEPAFGSLRQPLEANIGHAALLCLQSQSEVASQTVLFHRMGEDGIDQALRDTIPYFLGAVARDEARKRAQLRDARRNLARLEGEVQRAELSAQTIEVELGALFTEAQSVGLISDVEIASRAELIRVLQGARTATTTDEPLDSAVNQDRYRALEASRDQLRSQLRLVMDDRALLLNETKAADDFGIALTQQQSRLSILGLLPDNLSATEGEGDSGRHIDSMESADCPLCGSRMDEPDPTVDALRNSLVDLTIEVGNIAGARPSHRQALADLESRAESLREELRIAQAALQDIERGRRVNEETQADNRDFTRGRIDATLARATLTDDVALEILRQRLRQAQETVDALAAELDDDSNREELTSRLVVVGRDIRRYAGQLQLEHSAEDVRLDLAKLTVVADTPTGPAPLSRIGSAKNWVGYHLATHLALHRFLTQQNRPVPRFLMLDQPTQAHYPSEKDNETGLPVDDADRIAVRAMFQLMRDVAADLAPNFQIIVCDHADLPEGWFSEAVRYRWRNGEKLIPTDWIES